MFVKQLTLTTLLYFFCLAAHSGTINSDSAFILVKGTDPKSPLAFIRFTNPGGYFQNFSFTTNTKSPVVNGPLYRVGTTYPLEFNMSSYPNQLKGIALPGDTTTVEIRRMEKGMNIKFYGKAAPACQFYYDLFNVIPSRYNLPHGIQSNHLKYYLLLEERYQWMDSFYNAYTKTHKLPEWFHSYYKVTKVYEKALGLIENIHATNNVSTKKVYPNPESLLWFRDIAIDNPQAMNKQVYFDFLWQYFLWKEKIWWDRKMGAKAEVDWANRILDNVKKELKDPVREWFLKELLINFYMARELSEVDNAFANAKPYIKNEKYLAEISNYRDKAVAQRELRFAASAKVGSRAPGFYLADSLNQRYSLEMLRGRWALIRFYDAKTFCDSSFNYTILSDTVNFHKSKIQVVNIYTDSDKEYWKKALSPYPKSGVHLFCQGNWGERLTYLYGLRSLPYLVLVDPKLEIKYSGNPNYNEVIAVLKK